MLGLGWVGLGWAGLGWAGLGWGCPPAGSSTCACTEAFLACACTLLGLVLGAGAVAAHAPRMPHGALEPALRLRLPPAWRASRCMAGA